MTSMRKKQFYLTERQYAFLQKEVRTLQIKESEVLRRIIDVYIETQGKQTPQTKTEATPSTAGF